MKCESALQVCQTASLKSFNYLAAQAGYVLGFAKKFVVTLVIAAQSQLHVVLQKLLGQGFLARLQIAPQRLGHNKLHVGCAQPRSTICCACSASGLGMLAWISVDMAFLRFYFRASKVMVHMGAS